jgi:hypothetical protein
MDDAALKLRNTALQLSRQVECAKSAGIYDAMFLAFGSLLGYVRNGGFISGDDDMDVGFVSEMITSQQEEEYIRLVGTPTREFPEHGLFEYRREMARRDDNNRLFWISVRGKPAGECFKCCHWFFWKQQGYAWHCKGRGAAVKGMPEAFLEIGPEIEFLGVKIHAPRFTGSMLDLWYTDWYTPRAGGCSAKKIILDVKTLDPLAGSVKESGIG